MMPRHSTIIYKHNHEWDSANELCNFLSSFFSQLSVLIMQFTIGMAITPLWIFTSAVQWFVNLWKPLRVSATMVWSLVQWSSCQPCIINSVLLMEETNHCWMAGVSQQRRVATGEVRWVRRDTRLTIRVKVWGRGSCGAKSQRLRWLRCWTQARAESGARADWQAKLHHSRLSDHLTSCTVFQAIVVFAMTTMARSFTTHLTSFVVHRVRFESGAGLAWVRSEPGPRTHLTSLLS